MGFADLCPTIEDGFRPAVDHVLSLLPVNRYSTNESNSTLIGALG